MCAQRVSYKNYKAISNSYLSLYEDDFEAFARWWKEGISHRSDDDESLTIGSIVDILLTRPRDFNNEFIIFQGEAPTAQMLAFCQNLAKLDEELYSEEQKYDVAYKVVGFKRDSLEKVIEKFNTFKPYYRFLLESRNKQVITMDQSRKASRIVEQLIEGKYTKKYTDVIDIDGVINVYNQVEIYSEFVSEEYKIPIKGAIDRIIVDHTKKTIQPIDFKTSYSVPGFENSYIKYRYYRQGSFYTELIKSVWIESMGLDISYTVLPFIFVVGSTTGGKHYTYEMSDQDIESSRYGGVTKRGHTIKGWNQLLSEIAFLDKEGSWEYPYNALLNNGKIHLNIF